MSDKSRLENNNLELQNISNQVSTLPNFVISQEDYDIIESQADDLLGGNPAPVYTTKPNIFVQSTEPTSKDGIWLQTNKTAEHYISDDNIFFGGTWSLASDTAPIPYDFFSGSAVAIGTDIYILGGNNNYTRAYKYNTLTNTYTQLTDIPYDFYNGSAVAIGTDIYLLGSSNSKTKNCKYNTLTNTYTQLTNIPYSFYQGSAVAIGTDIYLLGGSGDNRNYKYNTLTDTYTQLTNIPYSFYQGSAVAIGTDIYILGSMASGSLPRAYKYNTLTNTYTQLTNIPYNFYTGSAVAIGTDIYLLGCFDKKRYNYKYNTLTDTYTQLTNIPYDFYNGSAVAIGTDIYLLGGNSSRTNIRIYHLENKSYELDNNVIIAQGRTYDVGYNVKLFETNFESAYQPLYGFADAWFYTTQDGLIKNIPTYYGNGTSWIKFKN